MTGPEFQPGWRDEFVERGRIIRIEARHYPRKRLPRGHEIARQMVRRGMVQMFEDPIYEWTLIVGRMRMHTIRHLPGGFQVAGDRQVYRTLREAAISKNLMVGFPDAPQRAMRLIRIVAPHFVTGFESDGTVLRAALILGFMTGWPDDRARAYIAGRAGGRQSLKGHHPKCALIRDLATDQAKREMFDRLHSHLTVLAAQVEEAMLQRKSGT